MTTFTQPIRSAVTSIFLCPAERLHWIPIMDRLAHEQPTFPRHMHRVADKVLDMIPEKGPCIVITDSLVSGTMKDAAEFARLCRERNALCRVILYTGESYDLNPKDFDCHINAFDSEGYDELFKKIAEYIS